MYATFPADTTNYMGAKVVLWQNDTYRKTATVLSVDALGWTFRIDETNDPKLKAGQELFVSHACPLQMLLVKD